MEDLKTVVRARYGENHRIYGDYDRSHAVKCVNGTFVGVKEDDIIAYKGIPFVGEQPVGKNRFKKPVPYKEDEGIYEAYHFAKGSLQPESPDDAGALWILMMRILPEKLRRSISLKAATRTSSGSLLTLWVKRSRITLAPVMRTDLRQ